MLVKCLDKDSTCNNPFSLRFRSFRSVRTRLRAYNPTPRYSATGKGRLSCMKVIATRQASHGLLNGSLQVTKLQRRSKWNSAPKSYPLGKFSQPCSIEMWNAPAMVTAECDSQILTVVTGYPGHQTKLLLSPSTYRIVFNLDFNNCNETVHGLVSERHSKGLASASSFIHNMELSQAHAASSKGCFPYYQIVGTTYESACGRSKAQVRWLTVGDYATRPEGLGGNTFGTASMS